MSRILDTIARRKNNEKKSDVKFELNRLISVRIETETTKANNFQKKKRKQYYHNSFKSNSIEPNKTLLENHR